MARYLGDIFTITALVRDSTGALADATAVTVTITKPDGTVTGSASATRTATGTYTYAYTPDMAGLHLANFTATGVNQSAAPVEFYVHPVNIPGIVGLSEVKTHLNMSTTQLDDYIRDLIESASAQCEKYTMKSWRRQTVTELHDGGVNSLRLRRPPAVSITAVTENGGTATGYVLDPTGSILYRDTWGYTHFIGGPAGISVTYVAAPAGNLIPPPIRRGVMELVRHTFEPQRGGSGMPRQAGSETEWDMRFGASVMPRRVVELWEPYRGPGI